MPRRSKETRSKEYLPHKGFIIDNAFSAGRTGVLLLSSTDDIIL